MPNILTSLINRQRDIYGDSRTALRYIVPEGDNGVVYGRSLTLGDFAAEADACACALAMLDVEPQEMIAIFAPNCPEMLAAEFGAFRNRAVPVAIYATSTAEQVRYIVRDAGASVIFVACDAQYRAVREVVADCPSLRHIVIIDSDVVPDKADTMAVNYSDFVEMGRMAGSQIRSMVALRASEATPDDIATLIYTSGTTGEPKGAILTHSCFDAAIDMHRVRLDTLSDADTSLCFLPLSHIFEKAWTYFCIASGIEVTINRDPRRVQQALKLARPTCMCSVPRFWEKAYTTITEKLGAMKGFARIMARRALKVGMRRNLEYARLGIKAPWWLEAQYRFFDRKVFSRVRAAMGIDHGNLFPTAGAPLSTTIVEFFHAIGINIVVGYGLSETTATVSCYPTIGFEVGTVGTVLPDLQVRTGENNEILVKGPTVMKGYYRREKETAEAFTADGYFRTGDAGLFDENGALVLTERIKDLFKTSNGKYIAPQAIESRLGEDRYIEQVAVIGDQRKYVTAIIIPAFEALKEYAAKKHIQFSSLDDLVQNSEVRRFIAERIERLQKGFAGFEKIKRFTLLPREFSIEGGELTNTLKIRRPVINSLYAAQIEAMYA